MSAATKVRTGGLGVIASWLMSLTVAMVGIGLVFPSPAISYQAPPQLIGKRTGDVLIVPALKVRAPLVSVSMSKDDVLTPPNNPREVGWWNGSAVPGSTHGQTLVTGHTVHTGGGALDKLSTLAPGDRVKLTRTRHGQKKTTTYRVSRVHDYSKAALSRDADQLFGQSGGYGRLILVTCTGWDGVEYHGNTVVFAEPLHTVVTPVS